MASVSDHGVWEAEETIFYRGGARENHLLFIRKAMTLNQVLNNTVWPI